MAAGLSWSTKICFLYISLSISFFIIISTDAKNTLGPNQLLMNGETLISANQRFQLGFFNPSPTTDPNLYLAIWYNGIQPLTAVWVANRAKPLRGNAVRLHMNSRGDLFIGDDQGNTICLSRSSNAPPAASVSSPSLILLDSGNLVIVSDSNKTTYVWQSFDSPSDTMLPGMKLGWDLKSKTDRVLTSWLTSNDPFSGDFVFRVESHDSPQLILQKNGVTESRWGPWNGQRFSGASNLNDNPVFKIVYHYSPEEVYFTFEMSDLSVLLRLVVSSVGSVQFLKWKSTSRVWVPMVTLNKDTCDRYGPCGPYGICYADGPGCHCLKGFRANSPQDWNRLDCTDGCRRRNALNCSDGGGDGFVKYSGIKLPDNFTVRPGLSPKKCEGSCLKDCSCMAYANIDMYANGSVCLVWLDELVDIRDSYKDGDELYIRMARVELDTLSHSRKKTIIIIISSLLSAVVFGAALWCGTSRYRSYSKKKKEQGKNDEMFDDVQLYDMKTVSAATDNFSAANKIGEGGFGPVYQGELKTGEKIAVKRLSEHSNQGLAEFKNEVHMIVQLQHRNLVKLLGCCIHRDERMLIYEYMPNKSLDQFLFDPAKKRLLQMEMRITILKGIARALEYLHFGSRLRVIHRDLKASNILLDDAMVPRISDFGLARNSENEHAEVTRRVIGTHGYMSPEYVMDGYYSTKSDIFSFGVLALEMISGQKNWGFHHPDHDFNLIGHAWKLWKDGKDLELIEPVLEQAYEETEVSRCIQVGLLCVQQITDERPVMSQVVSMLENDKIKIPEPKEPGFFTPRSRRPPPGIGSAMAWTSYSVNGLTLTDLTART
ncbi:hypothetical protein ABFX02_13G116500 [Erythranthe guttata]